MYIYMYIYIYIYIFFLTEQPTAVNQNQNQCNEISVFSLLKMCAKRIKNSKYHLIKMKGSNYTVVVIKIPKVPATSFQSSE